MNNSSVLIALASHKNDGLRNDAAAWSDAKVCRPRWSVARRIGDWSRRQRHTPSQPCTNTAVPETAP